jgi:hypothetical protein
MIVPLPVLALTLTRKGAPLADATYPSQVNLSCRWPRTAIVVGGLVQVTGCPSRV